MEPGVWSYILNNALALAGPFLAYFLGIVIRKKAMPGKRSLPMSRQLLLGIPVSLVVVSPFLPLIDAVTSADSMTKIVSGFLTIIGIIMEHGMLVNETATYHLNSLSAQMQRGRRSAGNRKLKSEEEAEPSNSTIGV